MAFRITMTQAAEDQFHALRPHERKTLETAILSRLPHQPTTPTRAVKRLRPNPFAEYELRVGDLRVLYNVEGDEVILWIIGRKVGNALIVDGVEFHEHQTDPPGPS